ncbi:protease inhibitor I42 family protein [Dyella koreensis]|uniref:Protease inhibitor I42 family protein n=1 Tax=Dyella koreensis TaxID=311235 RepID=A0ABW8K525_9GAMM
MSTRIKVSIAGLLITCSTLTCALASAADTPKRTAKPAVVVTEANDRQEVTLDAGQLFCVRLPQNPSTGMSWSMNQVPAGILKPLGEPTDHSTSKGTAMVGQPGTTQWAFIATGANTSDVQQTLRFEYRQWWSKDFDAPGKVIFFHVVVHAKNQSKIPTTAPSKAACDAA